MIHLDRGEYNKKCGIYVICDRKKNIAYVGSTNNLYSRINSHRNSLYRKEHCNPRLQYHYNKYGDEVFEVVIAKLMPSNSTHSELLLEEQIEYDKTKLLMECFNSHEDVTFFKNNPALNKIRSNKIKLSWIKDRDRMLNIVNRNLEKAKREYRRKIDSGELIMISPRKGVKVSKETREKQSLSARNRKSINYNCIPIYRYKLTGEFIDMHNSAVDGLAAIGILNKNLAINVRNCAYGKRRTACGFIWSYLLCENILNTDKYGNKK